MSQHLPVTFTVEIPKAWWMSSNHRPHWAKRKTLTAHLRHLAALEARRQRLPKDLPPVDVVAYIHPPTRRSEDPNNANPTTKALIDGLTDYGCWPDDSEEYVTGPDHRLGEPNAGQRLVRFVITPRGPS